MSARYLRWAFAAFIIAVLPAFGAHAAYVLFFHTYGDWSVICSKDEASGRRWCNMSAPPPSIATSEPRTVVTISEPTPGNFSIGLNVGTTTAPEQPAFLRVDGNLSHRVQPNRVGEAGWSGSEAVAIVDQLKRGKAMVVRSFAAWTGAPRDEIFSLDGFNEALSAYREKRRTYGVTPDK